MNYQRIYDQIIDRAKKEYSELLRMKKNGIYYEGHHIIPTCLGGTGKAYNWDHENIVPLTAREHFIVHWILARLYPNNHKLTCAFWRMCNPQNKNKQYYITSSRVYNEAKILSAKNHSIYLKGENNPMYGKERLDIKGDKHWMKKEKYKKMFSNKFSGENNPMFGKIYENHPNAKIVQQFTKCGLLISEYSTLKYAGEKTNTQRSHISSVCAGRRKYAGGFIWKFKQ